jgi:hypothetical protein
VLVKEIDKIVQRKESQNEELNEEDFLNLNDHYVIKKLCRMG